jgi:shikimate dehydrogenase
MLDDSPIRLIRVGLVGAGIEYSRAPALHMDEAARLGMPYRYDLFDLDSIPGGALSLGSILDNAHQQGFAGLNITYPCKQAVLPLLDELSVEAAALQAVNTVVFKNHRRIGHNTDWWGFAESFRRGLGDVPRERVVLVGAGGAGAAAAYAAAKLGVAELTIVDREVARALILVERLATVVPGMRASAQPDAKDALRLANGLIHATPCGMLKLPGMAIPEHYLHAGLWVAEIVYVPLDTELVQAATRLNCRTLDGGGMAVFQAVMAFKLFTGVEPDAERMLRSFRAQISSGA